MPAVQGVHVTVEQLPRELRVERVMRELRAAQQRGRHAGDRGLGRPRAGRIGRPRGREGRHQRERQDRGQTTDPGSPWLIHADSLSR